jgi:hypothetical protein
MREVERERKTMQAGSECSGGLGGLGSYRLQRAIKLEVILARIVKVKLSGSPRSISWCCPGATLHFMERGSTTLEKFLKEKINIIY